MKWVLFSATAILVVYEIWAWIRFIKAWKKKANGEKLIAYFTVRFFSSIGVLLLAIDVLLTFQRTHLSVAQSLNQAALAFIAAALVIDTICLIMTVIKMRKEKQDKSQKPGH